MGLDMYLNGKCFAMYDAVTVEDGYPVTERILEVGYWRKHPDLHGYIVKEFANGVDECQPIPLEPEDIEVIIQAVESDSLPKTTGFFFGTSDDSRKEETLNILRKALTWVNTKKDGIIKSLVYQASW